MVVFICNACGQSVKKNAVDKHWQTQCRNCTVLSCIDCGKDFPGETYRSHNQCMTEQEKWHGKDFKPKEGATSGKKKQDAWTESLQNAATNFQSKNPQLFSVIQRLLAYENVPRKEAKFKNFLKNCMKIHDYQIITAVWDIISSGPKPSTNGQPAVSQEVNGTEPSSVPSVEPEDPPEIPILSSIDNKKTLGQNSEVIEENTQSKFRWKRSIASLLSDSDTGSLSKKKLKKKVFRQYLAHGASELSEEGFDCKFEKYLSKYPSSFSVEGRSVTLAKS